MLFTTGLLVATAISALLMGLFVWSRSPSRIDHAAFLLVTLNVALYAVGVGVVFTTTSPDVAEALLRFTFVISAFLPASLFLFLELFPRPLPAADAEPGQPRTSLALSLAVVVVSLLVATATFTPLYGLRVELIPNAPPEVWQTGLANDALGVFIVLCYCLALARMLRKLWRASGLVRRQIQYVLLGIFVSSGLAIGTNVLMPLLGSVPSQPYGPSFFLIMVAFFGYAMMRYHLLDVWVIVGRTTLYALLTFGTAFIFLGSVWLVQLAIPRSGLSGMGGESLVDSGLLSSFIAAVLVVMIILPLRNRLQTAIDRALVKREYDSNRLMARISREATQMHDLDNLLQTVGEDLYRTVGAEPTRILLLEGATNTIAVGRARIRYSSQVAELGQAAPRCPELLAHMSVHEQPLSLEALLHQTRLAGVERGRHQARIAAEMETMGCHLCVPLTASAGLIGFIGLGPKVSREAWTREDDLVFSTVAAPLATAIANARLYDQLHEANQQRARILARMNSGVVAVSSDGVIVLINESARALFPASEVGESLESLPEPVREALVATLAERQEISDYEVSFTAADNDDAHVVVSTAILPAQRGDGSAPGAMALVYDMTQLKRLERNVQRADRLTSLGMLAAGMAHEIKNPLVSIKTFAQLLGDRFDDPEFREAFVDLVPSEVDRIDSIVSRLLDFARPNAPRSRDSEPKRGETLREPLNMREVLRKVLALLDNQIERNQIELETQWPDDPRLVLGDAQQMHQVFLNLLLNAIDAMRDVPKRRLRVCVSHERQQAHRPGRLPMAEQAVAVIVEDSGSGILPEHMDQMFTPFFTTKEHGSGLGLAVVHGIITEHGGQVDATVPSAGGARFTVTLPAIVDTSETVRSDVAPAAGGTVELPAIAQRKG